MIRLAVRAVVLHDDRLLLVNAWQGRTHLWTCPGGGAEPHSSLPENLAREVREETGLVVAVGEPCLVNEFHDLASRFHQVDIYFRCEVVAGEVRGDWVDPEGVVTHRRWVARAEIGGTGLRVKPDVLAAVAWGDVGAILYDPLEPIVR